MLNKIKSDLLPSLVVFLIALPLCMGIAIASGMPPIAGIITGILGGIVVGSLSGCELQVSGPAAGLAVIVYQFVEKYGADGLAFILLFAGLIQLAMGSLKLGQLFRAISPAIIQGMLAGIGTLIILSQWHVMLDSKPLGSGLQNLFAIPMTVSQLIAGSAEVSRHAFIIGVVGILIMALWPVISPKKMKLIPGSLVAAILLTVVALALSLEIQKIKLPENLLASMQYISLDKFSSINYIEVLPAAFTLAFVATAETLLSANAVDQMHHGPRTNYDRELISQGVGNTLCGIFCALPMTGVIVRSGANVQAGATSRMSAVLHGIWLLVFAIIFPSVLMLIPVSALAAVLVFTGYKLLNVKYIKGLWHKSRTEVAIFVVTYLTVVFVDLLKGIILGLLLATLKLIYSLTHLEIKTNRDEAKKVAEMHIKGAATFLRLPQLARSFDVIPSSYKLKVHIEDLSLIDHACLELLENAQKRFSSNGGDIDLEWEHLNSKFGKKT